MLVRFDDEKIEEALSDGSIDQRIGELSLMQVEEEFPRDEKLLDLNFEMAKTAREQLLEDFEYYQNTDRPITVRIANYRYNSAEEDLESQREEWLPGDDGQNRRRQRQYHQLYPLRRGLAPGTGELGTPGRRAEYAGRLCADLR